VIPYIDAHYRTLPDRGHRSITGISNGAAIAARAAFQAPNLFGRVAVLSGGIADGEQEKFTNWISAMPSGQRPEVLISVGDQDGIILLTRYFSDLLDKNNYPYTFIHGPGNHEVAFWNSHLEEYLKWLEPFH
jgi:enterochelin esterase-like enzyme